MANVGIIATKRWVISLINSVLKKKTIELTEEHKTGELFNGKPVWEVTKTGFKVPVTTTGTSVDEDIDFFDEDTKNKIEKILSVDGVVYLSTNGAVLPLPWISADQK